MADETADETQVDEATEKKLEAMNKTGELEVEFEDDEPKEENPKEVDKGNGNDPEKYNIDGTEYTKEELAEQLKRAKDIENDENWKKANTLRSQELAKKEAELNDKYASLRAKVQGDDVLEGMLDPISKIDQRLAEIEQREAQIRQREDDQRQIDLMVADAEKRLGVKIDKNSDEFKQMAKELVSDNPLYLKMLAKGTSPKAPTNLRPSVDVDSPGEDEISPKEMAQIKNIAQKAGIPLKSYLKYYKK